MRRTPVERFWHYTDRKPGCWLWRGPTKNGYGELTLTVAPYTRKGQSAHRFSYELAHGPIPDGLLVLHRCDTPLCVNSGHLFLGNHGDNMADRNAKGRQARHATHGRAKLTVQQVHTIRADFANGATKLGLSRKYAVGRTAIRALLAGRTWRGV